MIPVMADRSKLATERMSVSIVRAERRMDAKRVTFCALEGSLMVLIEADSEDEAHAIDRRYREALDGYTYLVTEDDAYAFEVEPAAVELQDG